MLAFSAAMQVMGASFVETPDTRGTDGSNVHLGDPLETITGYYGGVGQPNDRALKWVDEVLYYYTNCGISEVLNINAGTVFLGYMLYKLGIDIRFKISVMLGNDSPYTGLWTLLGAKLFEREDGTSPLIGLNWSCAANNETLRSASQLRSRLGFEDVVRFEHHIVQCRWGTVTQPYDRREELMELAATVPNISAKHEGGDVEAEAALLAEGKHASNVLDYFREKAEILEAGDWDALLNNYIEKHNAVNHTARELTRHGLSFIAAPKLHRSTGQ